MTIKNKVIKLIVKGLGNSDIAEETGATSEYINNIRVEYNANSNNRRIPSVRRKPLANTGARRAFEFMLVNPHLTMLQVAAATGVDKNTCRRTCKIYMPRLLEILK